jgi:hypothetical protein
MDAADVARLNSQVDAYCLKHRQPLYGYDAAHQCGKECVMLGTFPKFICLQSRKIHLCGPGKCCHGYTGSEGTFCMLTGYELYGPEDNVSRAVVRDSCGQSTRHWGEEMTVDGKRARVKRNSTDFLALFKKAVVTFLASPERQTLYEYEMTRYAAAIKRTVRKQCVATPTVIEAAHIVREVWLKHKKQCSAPLSGTTRWLPELAQQIYSFWKQTSVQITRKSVPSLTAVALSFLARDEGYSLNGVLYVKPSKIVAKHAVTDMQFGKFSGLTCRRMSIIIRELMKSLLTNDGQQRIIKPLEFGGTSSAPWGGVRS